MYRLALASLMALALMETAAACPPAERHVKIVNGVEVVEWVCPPGKVVFPHENVHRCFDRCASCPNGFCHGNNCHCFPGTQSQNGVCGKICPNCHNGWCSSMTKCECNDGYISVNGFCMPAPQPAIPNGYYPYPAWPPHWDPRRYPPPPAAVDYLPNLGYPPICDYPSCWPYPQLGNSLPKDQENNSSKLEGQKEG